MTVASAWQFTDGIQVIKYLIANFVCSYMTLITSGSDFTRFAILTVGLHLNYAVAPDLVSVLNYYLFKHHTARGDTT